MNWLRWKAAIAALLMLSVAAAAHVWKPTLYMAATRPQLQLEEIFPKHFGAWVIDDRTPAALVSPDTQALLDKIYSQILSRTYKNDRGDRIMLSVAYGGDQSEATRAHRPEVCYPAQGFEVLSSEVASVANSGHPIRVKRLVAKRESRVEPITYWVIVGDHVTLSGTEQKWQQMTYGLQGVIPDGMLVRVSNVSGDKVSAFAIQDEFIRDMSSAIPSSVRTRVIGVNAS